MVVLRLGLSSPGIGLRECMAVSDEANVLVGELRIVQYIDSDGVVHTLDLSESNGGAELSEEMYEHLIGWASAFALAPKVAAILASVDDESGG